MATKTHETHDRLLDAAGAVFAEKGYHHATVAEICERAGANIAAVNYYFRSKDNLYVEAWREAFQRSVRAHPPDGGVAADGGAETAATACPPGEVARLDGTGVPLRQYDPRDLPRTTAGNAALLKLPSFPQASAELIDQYAAAFTKVLAHADDVPRETA